MNMLRSYINRIATVLTIAVSLLLPIALQHTVAAAPADEVCAGIAAASGSGCNGSDTSLNNIITNGVNTLSVFIGIVAVVVIMIAGFKLITANGDTSNINSARSMLMYAAIGLVIVAMAQSIVHFVLHAATTAPTPTKAAPKK